MMYDQCAGLDPIFDRFRIAVGQCCRIGSYTQAAECVHAAHAESHRALLAQTYGLEPFALKGTVGYYQQNAVPYEKLEVTYNREKVLNWISNEVRPELLSWRDVALRVATHHDSRIIFGKCCHLPTTLERKKCTHEQEGRYDSGWDDDGMNGLSLLTCHRKLLEETLKPIDFPDAVPDLSKLHWR